ncbi:hypothetical protein A1Q2_06928 [Trichosporon asahii var. asahii CBS 8904]|jgi:large subunit ribosomal protein L47|uniref:Uncharacterized protein n=2 Tax=Trichosporon asahii var. asahii TaxID=189963 RepID=K1VHV4_TRIAC|nr:hypothetical protein A1Q2_06928 [Trichosporon asahii var. asahii CBS 8904]
MARIKYVLNERRLALIAAGAATLPAPQGVTVPSTLPGRNDPMAAVEALHAIGPVPDVVKLTEGKRTKLSGQEKADEALFEEDEADQAAYEEVQKEEEAAKLQAEKAKEETK